MHEIPPFPVDHRKHNTAKAEEDGQKGLATERFAEEHPPKHRREQGVGGKQHIGPARPDSSHGRKEQKVAKDDPGQRRQDDIGPEFATNCHRAACGQQHAGHDYHSCDHPQPVEMKRAEFCGRTVREQGRHGPAEGSRERKQGRWVQFAKFHKGRDRLLGSDGGVACLFLAVVQARGACLLRIRCRVRRCMRSRRAVSDTLRPHCS